MQSGYVKLWRSVIDCGLMQRPNEFTLFCYLLMQAAREPFKYGTKAGIVDIPVGGYISTLDRLSADLSLSKQEVRTSIKNLEKMEILTCKPTNKYTLYIIDNYDKYQSSNTDVNTHSNTQSTRNQHATNTQLTLEQELKNLRIKELKKEEQRAPATTPAGLICKALISAGIPNCNSSHPTFLKLIDAGATENEFYQAALAAVENGKANFAYVVGVVKGQRADAAKMALHKGPMPAKRQNTGDGDLSGKNYGEGIQDL